MSTAPRRPPPRWLRLWEDLPILAQVGIVGPLAILLMWAAHIYLMNQPVWRGLVYGIFWGVLLTGVVVGATRSERARRDRGR